jgi:L-aminopeptidase/D-esterase-like protein
MHKSKSDNVIKTNIKNVYISQVQYASCGMTVVSSDKYLDFYINKRGKNIYGLGTDVLYGTGYTASKAICLVGSSTLGLEGICGVNQALIEENGSKHNDPAIGACCYTFNIIKKDFTHPDIKLGKFAIKNRDKELLIGDAGAGVNTRVGKIYKDWKKNNVFVGQGVSYYEKDKMKCLCIVVFNSMGVIHEKGNLLHDFKIGKKKISNINEMPHVPLMDTAINVPKDAPKNTTLTIFLTNVCYDEEQMKNQSDKLHDVVESMVYPYGTCFDGDTFFFVSSKEINTTKDYLNDYKKVVIEAIKSPFNE